LSCELGGVTLGKHLVVDELEMNSKSAGAVATGVITVQMVETIPGEVFCHDLCIAEDEFIHQIPIGFMLGITSREG